MATRNVEWLDTSLLDINEGQMEGLPKNPRTWTKDELNKLKKSLEETPELFEARPILAYDYDGRLLVLGGNMRLSAAKALGMSKVPVYVYPSDTPLEKLKEIVIKDNGAFGAWDWDMLANEWDALPLSEWGVPTWNTDIQDKTPTVVDDDEIERKRREFDERMANGENLAEDDEYLEFLDKFAQKKTTDDCYTPAPVYEAVAKWVENEYNVKRADFVRPFFPGGDYKSEKYKPTDIVVDNPPFSILAEIIKFYSDNGIRFFLFAPALTLFSSSTRCCAIGVGVQVIYENKANVSTSFVTNLEDESLRFRTAPTLYAAVKSGVEEFTKEIRKQFPKYAYDHHVVTSPFLTILSRLGIDFSATKEETVSISRLDSQKGTGKVIYGKGYLVGETKFAEREKAEREKAERWELSPREREIVKRLG